MHSSRARRNLLAGALFLLPAALLIVAFFLYPVLRSFQYSLTDWDGVSGSYQFVGLKNFETVLTTRQLSTVLLNTLILAVIYIPVLNVVALALAVLIKGCGRLQNLYKAVVFFPNILALAVIGYVWKMLYDANNGVFNQILRMLGLGALAQDWLGSVETVLPAISLTTVWYAAGFYMAIYLAGLMGIPKDLYEAGDIDGATPWQSFRHITLPMLAPSITINVVLSTIGILSMFDLPYTMTNGGPGYYSTTVALQIYFYNSKSMQLGNGVALSVLLCVVSIAVTLLQMRLLSRKEG